MKINPNNGLTNQPINDRKPVHTSSGTASSVNGGTVDRATFVPMGPRVTNLVNQAMQTPSVRQDKVSSLRDAVSSGNYSIDSSAIANAITSESGS